MLKRRLKEPFGKAGLTVAILALVMALVGGAYAAGGLSKSQEKQVKKIAKKYAGKPGKPGAAGATGPAGANGKDGAAGEPGTNGKNGTNGKSVTVAAATSGPTGECEEGGATVEVEGSPGTKKHVCNGSPWTLGGTLPKGASEKGTWAAPILEPFGNKQGMGPISFGIPLNTVPAAVYLGPGASHTVGTGKLTSGSNTVEEVTKSSGEFAVGETISGAGIPAGTTIEKVAPPSGEPEELFLSANATATGTGVALTADPPAGCPGTAEEPTAAEGKLCVYAETEALAVFEETNLVGKVGARVRFHEGAAVGFVAFGTWAVTAE